MIQQMLSSCNAMSIELSTRDRGVYKTVSSKTLDPSLDSITWRVYFTLKTVLKTEA